VLLTAERLSRSSEGVIRHGWQRAMREATVQMRPSA
jgi:hypothetical protein